MMRIEDLADAYLTGDHAKAYGDEKAKAMAERSAAHRAAEAAHNAAVTEANRIYQSRLGKVAAAQIKAQIEQEEASGSVRERIAQ